MPLAAGSRFFYHLVEDRLCTLELPSVSEKLPGGLPVLNPRRIVRRKKRGRAQKQVDGRIVASREGTAACRAEPAGGSQSEPATVFGYRP